MSRTLRTSVYFLSEFVADDALGYGRLHPTILQNEVRMEV